MQKDLASLYKDARKCLEEIESNVKLATRLIENASSSTENLDVQERMKINDNLAQIRHIGARLAEIEERLKQPS